MYVQMDVCIMILKVLCNQEYIYIYNIYTYVRYMRSYFGYFPGTQWEICVKNFYG